jgi:hypothetical protein
MMPSATVPGRNGLPSALGIAGEEITVYKSLGDVVQDLQARGRSILKAEKRAYNKLQRRS